MQARCVATIKIMIYIISRKAGGRPMLIGEGEPKFQRWCPVRIGNCAVALTLLLNVAWSAKGDGHDGEPD
jgi:hypothetical protein